MSRGGAGNIEAAQQASTLTPTDVEAIPSPSKRQEESERKAETREYAHTGRGGAGNWFQPLILLATGNVSSSSPASPGHTRKPSLPSPHITHTGRGGAGNFLPASPTSPTQDAPREAAEASAKAEKDVELGLPKPPQAFLGGREKAEDLARGMDMQMVTKTIVGGKGAEMAPPTPR